ncbi:hypothetical protein [uncultured Polaribacter sp.]|uniref:hypothetical protein n=1 Tax=uncultured Polaribacter sp. TaxID=174711 RepID=UPI002602585B|nr:hypothetical protein [uncultured Polaribacter sp.]
MNSKEYYKKKTEGFITFWETKRDHKLKYALLQSVYYAIPFSIVFQALENTSGFLTLQFGFKLLAIFCIYFLLSFYVSFNIYERKYQKLKKRGSEF